MELDHGIRCHADTVDLLREEFFIAYSLLGSIRLSLQHAAICGMLDCDGTLTPRTSEER